MTTFTSRGARPAVAAAAIVAGLATAAYGGDATPSTLDAAFRAKVDAVCAKALAARKADPFPLPDFDPRHPKAGELPKVGAFFERHGDAHGLARDLAALGAPATGAERWNELMPLVDREAANSDAMIAAAKNDDTAAWLRALDEGDEIRDKVGDVGGDLGYAESSDCAQLLA